MKPPNGRLFLCIYHCRHCEEERRSSPRDGKHGLPSVLLRGASCLAKTTVVGTNGVALKQKSPLFVHYINMNNKVLMLSASPQVGDLGVIFES